MNWYLDTGESSDIVTSTRIRFARNLSNYRFNRKMTSKEAENMLLELENIIQSLGYGLKLLKLKDIDDITKLTLVEKHLISPEFAFKNELESAIIINEEENICIMVNEEDHLRIQVFSSGFDLENLINLGIELDEKLGKLLSYATNEKYGFLTSCPTNVGTGMRASVMIDLPALSRTGNINKILDIINNFGMNIRGLYGENSKIQGNMYQISNKQSLGLTEEEIIKKLKSITEKVIEQERLARSFLGKNTLELEDKVYRDYGILINARKISSEEAINLLSNVKLGVHMGIIKEITDLQIKKLELYIKPANLQKYFGKMLDEYERDIKRAELIKIILKEWIIWYINLQIVQKML